MKTELSNNGAEGTGPWLLNGLCPYYTMFPLDFPLAHLAGVRPGAWVLDPFCGRGTTAFAARMLGLPSVGYDLNPVAVVIARAKLLNVQPASINRLARRLLTHASDRKPTGRFWELAFHPTTLRDLLRLRAGLRDMRGNTAAALRAIVLGALHGPQPISKDSYFSNQMQRTFAPKPDYAVRYWEERDLRPREVDVLEIVRDRAKRYYEETAPTPPSEVHLRDARLIARSPRRYTAIVTSPPYFGMDSYIPDQWLRSWFLGGGPRPEYDRAGQVSRGSTEDFARNLSKVWRGVALRSEKNAKLVIRFGGLNSRKSNPEDILLRSLDLSGGAWKVRSIADAGNAAVGRRQSIQMGQTARSSASVAEIDVVCRLQSRIRSTH